MNIRKQLLSIRGQVDALLLEQSFSDKVKNKMGELSDFANETFKGFNLDVKAQALIAAVRTLDAKALIGMSKLAYKATGSNLANHLETLPMVTRKMSDAIVLRVAADQIETDNNVTAAWAYIDTLKNGGHLRKLLLKAQALALSTKRNQLTFLGITMALMVMSSLFMFFGLMFTKPISIAKRVQEAFSNCFQNLKGFVGEPSLDKIVAVVLEPFKMVCDILIDNFFGLLCLVVGLAFFIVSLFPIFMALDFGETLAAFPEALKDKIGSVV